MRKVKAMGRSWISHERARAGRPSLSVAASRASKTMVDTW